MKLNAILNEDTNQLIIKPNYAGVGGTGRLEVTMPDGTVAEHNIEVLRAGLTAPAETKFSIINEVRKVVSMEDPTTGEFLDPVVYNTLLSKLAENADEYGDFSNLDEEYAYKKFVKKYSKANYVTVDEKIPLEIVITGKVKFAIDNEFITPIFSLSDNRNDVLYTYKKKKHVCTLIEKFFTERGFEKVPQKPFGDNTEGKMAFCIPSTGLKYTKAFGKYVFDDDMCKFQDEMTSNLKACQSAHDEIEKTFSRYLNVWYNRTYNKNAPLDKQTLNSVICDLKLISNAFSKVRAMKSSQNEVRQVNVAFREAIMKYENALLDESK